jgi:magnesium-transporting ATPase (P-type)
MSAEESPAETEDMSLTSERAASLTAEEVLAHLNVRPQAGLTTSEASRRRTIYGLNEVVVKEPTPLWKKYLDQVTFPLLIFRRLFIVLC